MSPPLVSVVIAAWNAGAYLPQTLASAIAQTWRNLEVILVDDGSSDETPAVVAPYLPRIRYERRTHRGLAAARNDGIRLAKGDYIALLDADDLWHPEKIAIQIAIAERHTLSGLIASNAEEFCEGKVLRGRLLQESIFRDPSGAVRPAAGGEVTRDFHREFIECNLIACPAQVLLPRRVVDRTGPFIDADAQDYDYYLRVSRHYPITFHREVLARWRYRPDSMSGPHADRGIRVGFNVLPVLRAHRSRCRTADRELLERRIRRTIDSLGYELMSWGRENRRRRAGSLLLELFRSHPWPPTPLVYLAALWSPDLVYRVGAQVARQRWTPH